MSIFSDIDLMMAERGNPCLSMVVPTHRYSRDRMQNPKLVENAVMKARSLLANSAWPKDKTAQLEARLDTLLEQVGYMRLQEGLAIFISPESLRSYRLPFPVREKVMLGKTFELRDLIYFSQFLKPYYLLAISRKRVRLFKGSGRDLQEVANSDFPKVYTEEYEYARPSIGSPSSPGLKSFERDKSVLQEARMNAFLRTADDSLSKYLREDASLILAGVGEELAAYGNITRHGRQIVGTITGNYDIDAVHPLAEQAWKQIRADVSAQHARLSADLQESVGRQRAVDGIRNVWKAAKEGKGLTLLLEKDYKVMAYGDPVNESQLFLAPPAGKYEIITDAADDLIEIVREKGGTIAIVENGALSAFSRIALILRYAG